MDLRNRYQDRSDDQETQYIPIQETGKRSDQYDTQKLSAEEIRRRISQEENARRSRMDRRNPNKPVNTPNNNNYNSGYNSGYNNSGYNRGYSVPPQSDYTEYGSNNRGAYNSSYQPYQQRNTGYRNPQQGQSYPPPPPPPRNNNNSRNNNSGYGQKQRQQYSKPKPRSKQKPLWQTVLRAILVLIIAVFLIYSAIALIGIFRTNIVASAERNHTDDALNSSSVDNILVIGTDSRDIETDSGRSDSIILLSINSKNNTIYMTSFLRDVYVYINDTYGSGKLNSAYAYGGPELLMDTIESNYGIRIDDYVLVSFAACAAVIDSVGGVEITLSDDEANALNEILISEVNELMGDKRNDDLLDGGGTYNLSGKQALSYSRIRYVGNADFERTSRQREVLSIAMKKACKNPVSICGIFLNALPEISTNIHGLSLYGYSLKAPFLIMGYDISQQQIPADGTFYPDNINGEDVLVADFTENNNTLIETVYNGVFD